MAGDTSFKSSDANDIDADYYTVRYGDEVGILIDEVSVGTTAAENMTLQILVVSV
jgi:hypothetical protein